MSVKYYKNRLNEIKQKPCISSCKNLTVQITHAFWDEYFYNDICEKEYIHMLCEMSVCFTEDINNACTSVLFRELIERLCDDFQEHKTIAYNYVMSHIISFCRKFSNCRAVDKKLKLFHINSFEDLYKRAESIRKSSYSDRKLPQKVLKILFLSRVTIGADIAVTSILIQKFKFIYPDTEFVVIGNSKLKELFGDYTGINIIDFKYERYGNLIDRLNCWENILKLIAKETSEYKPSDILIVDPDSRLSQLGILPVTDNKNYLFFNSRASFGNKPKISISELTNQWFNMVVKPTKTIYPALWPFHNQLLTAKKFINNYIELGCKHMIAVNFGVGGNSRKGLTLDFETDLLLNLLKEPETVVLLDMGFGKDEIDHSTEIIETVGSKGYRTTHETFQKKSNNSFDHGLIGIQTQIGEITALIAHSDEFIGYDSACQHIASSLHIPTTIIFAGSNDVNFIRHWRPYGKENQTIIHVDNLTDPPLYEYKSIVMRIMHSRIAKKTNTA